MGLTTPQQSLNLIGRSWASGRSEGCRACPSLGPGAPGTWPALHLVWESVNRWELTWEPGTCSWHF